MVALLEAGADVAVGEKCMSAEQRQRTLRFLVGEEEPRPHLTAEELIQKAKTLKRPAKSTVAGWSKALSDFLGFAGVGHPTAATREHAVAYPGRITFSVCCTGRSCSMKVPVICPLNRLPSRGVKMLL